MNEASGVFSVEQAEHTYNAKLAASLLKPTDPSAIKDEIVALKGFCAKLKFQYLEQDTRDKFIAHLFSENAESVSQSQVDTLAADNAVAKTELRQLKKDLAERIASSEAVAEDTIAMGQRLQAKRGELESTAAELAALEAEFEGIAGQPENESYRMLFDLNKMIDSQDVRPDEAIRIAENDLGQDQVTLRELEQRESVLTSEAAEMSRLAQDLEARLARMKIELEHASKTAPGHLDPEQRRAQWLRELNTLLQKLTPAPVEIRQAGPDYVLVCGRNEIAFDSDLKILRVLNHVLRTLDVNRANHVSGERKVEYLLRLMMHVCVKQTGFPS